MQAKLRPVGNSVGLTIPSSELQAVNAKAGDIVELEIKHVVRHVRAGWDDAALWQAADGESLLLETFYDEEWEW